MARLGSKPAERRRVVPSQLESQTGGDTLDTRESLSVATSFLGAESHLGMWSSDATYDLGELQLQLGPIQSQGALLGVYRFLTFTQTCFVPQFFHLQPLLPR